MADALQRIQSGEHGDVPGGGAWDTYKVFDNELVNATADVDSVLLPGSPGLALGQFRTFGFYVIVTGTSPDIDFILLQSYTNVDATFVIPEAGSAILTVADNNPHIISVTPSPMPYFRIRADGQGVNPANARVNAWIWMQS